MKIFKQDFQSKANRIEELKNVDYFSNGCLPAADHAQQQQLLWSKPSKQLRDVLRICFRLFGGFLKWGYPKWMVYNGQSQIG